MHTLPGRWHAAALLSGQIDLSQVYAQTPGLFHRLTKAQLTDAGIKPKHITSVCRGTPLQTEAAFVTLDDPNYPTLLRRVPYAPAVLFWSGNIDLLQAEPRIAIVGSRRCTGDGKRMASNLAQAVAAAGGSIISGLAYGIDSAAHTAAPSHTIAVLGQGLAVPKSKAASRVARTILDEGGLLLSEFVPTFPASKHTFPQRNRVIAGMAQMTVVVEAAQRSGASITARLALEAGRDVGAVPGSPFAPASAGCLRLLSEGAALIRGPQDLLGMLGAPTKMPPPTAKHPLLHAIGGQGAAFDTLVDALNMSAADLGAELGALELQGRIRRLPGDRFVLATSYADGSCAWAPSLGLE